MIPRCPYCGSYNVKAVNPIQGKYYCRDCGHYFVMPV